MKPSIKQIKVWRKVAYALVTGKLVKPSRCEDCDEEKALEAHHEDYDKPLDVNWVCSGCHSAKHGRGKTAQINRIYKAMFPNRP